MFASVNSIAEADYAKSIGFRVAIAMEESAHKWASTYGNIASVNYDFGPVFVCAHQRGASASCLKCGACFGPRALHAVAFLRH
jgi:hypothetical protein